MNVRPVGPGDRDDLRRFTCSDGSRHAQRLQAWIRRKAFGWSQSNINHRLMLLVDGASLVGLYGYEPGGIVVSLGGEGADDPEQDDLPLTRWFVKLVAVQTHYQGLGIGGRLLETCLDELSTVEESVAYWKVDDANLASHAMSRRTGAEAEPKPATFTLTTYFVLL